MTEVQQIEPLSTNSKRAQDLVSKLSESKAKLTS